MASKASGFFRRALNVIGLVDEPAEPDYRESYAPRGRNDGYMGRSQTRPSNYVPAQQRSRTMETRRRTIVQQDRSRYGAGVRQGSGSYDEGYSFRRTATAPAGRDPVRQADRTGGRPAAALRADSRFQPASRTAARPVPTQPQAQPVRTPASSMARTVMFTLTSLAECSDVVDTLIANDIVLLVLDQIDDATAQRVVDTLSGAAFALHATIRKASGRTYLIAPRSVEVDDPVYYGRR